MIKISNPHYQSVEDLAVITGQSVINAAMLADRAKKDFSLTEIRVLIPGVSRKVIQQIAKNLGANIDNSFDVDL